MRAIVDTVPIRCFRIRQDHNGVTAGMVGQALEKWRIDDGWAVVLKFFNAPLQKIGQTFDKRLYRTLLDEIGPEEFEASSRNEIEKRQQKEA